MSIHDVLDLSRSITRVSIDPRKGEDDHEVVIRMYFPDVYKAELARDKAEHHIKNDDSFTLQLRNLQKGSSRND